MRPHFGLGVLILIGLLAQPAALATTGAQQAMPELTAPVNDFANVVDQESAAAMDRMIRALLAKTGDAVVVATVPTIAPVVPPPRCRA